ncbi:hypothetical protein tinsulaeT_06670 [Thalassotalea insulae]|uniref:DUF998 domain-containing protein n=2 Tax=Thalassotalea insulae TaxID=2056778 RepID=A0ABQ6GRT2_9GAMM|nr:hypothetical protein tinsulaeT_06670 [Thalassotalea insulae]
MLVALIAVGTAIAHMSCIFLGPQCYAAQMAPPEIVQSAENGTLLAPLSTAFISLLFIIVGLYSLSSARVIRRLPLLSLAVYVISTLCIVRGLATIPSSFIYPELVSIFSTIAGAIWFLTGVMFILGHNFIRQANR